MNKNIKNIIFSFLIICPFLFSIPKVRANTIKEIDMDVYIDSSGNASITEVWNALLSQGTEGYRPYTKLGNSLITDFSVSDDSGKEYEVLSYWNTSASFDNKAYKCGINYITNGLELCWGISNYGDRTYTLKYNISNFVTQYTDTQGIYFNFLNLDQSVGRARITIHSDVSFSLDNARIWAFGNTGSINFENGNIVLDSDGNLSSSQYMVALVRFESNIFNTNNTSSKSFDDIYDSAMSDVDDDEFEDNLDDSFGTMILSLVIFFTLLNPVLWIIVIFLILQKTKGSTWIWGSGRRFGEYNYGPGGKKLPDDNQINYWRDIPCNKDLERAYWVCYQYDVVSSKTLRQGIIGAILLKWIRNGYVTVSKTKKGLFSFKDNNYAIDFTKMSHADNEIEESLFKMLVSASGSNKILEAKEFAKWCQKHHSKVNFWFSMINNKEQKYLEQQGLITKTTEETMGMFGRKKTIMVQNVSPKLKEDAIQLKGLKKFLLDFSIMPEREYFEVHLWEEYLIFAQLLGIADKVEEQFSKLYPRFNEESVLNTEISTVTARNMAIICYDGVKDGVRKAEARKSLFDHDYSGSSTDSGGGGSSYSSGGSSSGGSSGGGFR